MSYTRILRWVLLMGLSLAFFIPFILADGGGGYQNSFNMYIPFPNMFFPYITGKNFAFRILIEVLLGVYVLLALREPKYRPKSSTLMWAVGAFVLWIGVATLFSIDPIKSFWSNFERMEGYITILHLFVYFIIVGAVMAAEDWWERLFQVSIASSIVMGMYALFQLIHVNGHSIIAISSQSGTRVDTTFGNAIYLAVFMLFNIFITLFMLVRHRKVTWAQIVYGIALVLQGTSLYFTQTRGAFLGVVGGLIVAAIYMVWRAKEPEWQGLRRVSMWGLGAIMLLILLAISIKNTSFVRNSPTLNRMTTISLNDNTTHARIFFIWPMALKGAVESPKTIVFGWGQENFNFVFNKYYNPGMYAQEQWFDRAHNQFIDWLVAGGFPALILYLSLFVLMVLAVVRSDVLSVPEQAILLGLLAGYAFNNLTVFDDLMSSVYFFTLLAFVHSISKQKLPGRLFLSKPVNDHGVAIAAPIVLVATIFILWTLNVPGLARAQNVVSAITNQMLNDQGQVVAKDPKMILDEFKVALSHGAWPGTALGYQETAEQLMQFSSSQAQSNSVDPSVKKDTHDLAESAGKTVLAERPHDARLELFVGALYEAFGQYPNALEYLQRALADSPKKQQIEFEVGVVDINSNHLPDAVAVFKKAFESEPNYRDSRILYAAGLIYAGDRAAADQVLISGPKDQGFGSVVIDDPRLLQVYTNTKQYDRVIAIWKTRVEASPKDSQIHIGLAAAYFAASDKANTIKELQTAASLNPAVAAQANTLIKQIQDGTLKPGH